jgi:hypothetical protein
MIRSRLVLLRRGGDLVFKYVIVLALLASTPLAGAPTNATAPIVTILDGRATVIRALSQFEAAEGLRLQADDLVRTEKDSFVRIEYEDQTSLELGPDTLVQLNHPLRKRANRPALYLLSGWLKLGSGTPDPAPRGALAAPGMDVTDLSGVLVVRLTDASHVVFDEHGTARWLDRSTRGAQPIALKAGDFLVSEPEMPPKLQGRPAEDFLQALPRPYRDTLPFRYDRFKTRAVAAKGQAAFTYADVERWLNTEPSERRQFVVLWRRMAANAAFRASLDRDLPMHPEWDPVLHPEKYLPKEQQPGPSVANPVPTAESASSRRAEAEITPTH